MIQLQLKKKHKTHWVREITIKEPFQAHPLHLKLGCSPGVNLKKNVYDCNLAIVPEPKTIATIVNYTCKNFIKLTAGMLKTGLSRSSGGTVGGSPGEKGTEGVGEAGEERAGGGRSLKG